MKHLKTAIAVFALFLLTACSTAGKPVIVLPPPQTPEQIAANACGALVPVLDSLKLLSGLPDTTANELAAADKLVTVVCADGAAINNANLQTVATTAIPLILDVVKFSGLTIADQNKLILSIGIARDVLTVVLQQAAKAA